MNSFKFLDVDELDDVFFESKPIVRKQLYYSCEGKSDMTYRKPLHEPMLTKYKNSTNGVIDCPFCRYVMKREWLSDEDLNKFKFEGYKLYTNKG